jgi:adenosine deaminase
LGLRRVAHAGEDVGPDETQTPLTVCPVSNVALKVFPDMASHPIKRLMDAGVLVVINSDDPPMFHTDVLNDYIQVADTFDLTADDVERLARNSFEAAFMGDAARDRYLDRFKAEVSKLRAEVFG